MEAVYCLNLYVKGGKINKGSIPQAVVMHVWRPFPDWFYMQGTSDPEVTVLPLF